MDIFIPGFPTGERLARLFFPPDLELVGTFTQSGYDVLLVAGGALFIVSAFVIMAVVHLVMVGEHAETTAEDRNVPEADYLARSPEALGAA